MRWELETGKHSEILNLLRVKKKYKKSVKSLAILNIINGIFLISLILVPLSFFIFIVISINEVIFFLEAYKINKETPLYKHIVLKEFRIKKV